MGAGQGGEQKGEITKGYKQTIAGNAHVHYLECANGFTVYTCVTTYQIIHYKHAVYCVSILPQ